MKNCFSFFAFCCLVTIFTGCGGNDDEADVPANCAFLFYNEQINEALIGLSATTTAYAADPTTANCEAYRTQARAYINALKSFDGCLGIGDTQEYRNELAEAEAELIALSC